MRERRGRFYHMCYLAECWQHLCSSLMRPWGTLCRWVLMDRWLAPKQGHWLRRLLLPPLCLPIHPPSFSVHVIVQFVCVLIFPFFVLIFSLMPAHFLISPKLILVFASSPRPPLQNASLCHRSPLQTMWLIRRWIGPSWCKDEIHCRKCALN